MLTELVIDMTSVEDSRAEPLGFVALRALADQVAHATPGVPPRPKPGPGSPVPTASRRSTSTPGTETTDLTPDQRRQVDSRIAPDLPHLGDQKLARVVRRLVFRLDPEGAASRREKARTRRHVSHRVYGDGTAVISAVVSDLHLSAILSSLQSQARRTKATLPDDERSHTQLVADIFVRRLAGSPASGATPVALGLVMNTETLLGGPGSDHRADLAGVGPDPRT